MSCLLSRTLFVVSTLVVGSSCFALDFRSCKNSKQIQYVQADLKIALAQKLISREDLKDLEKYNFCYAYQMAAEELLKTAAERASNQTENDAEKEP